MLRRLRPASLIALVAISALSACRGTDTVVPSVAEPTADATFARRPRTLSQEALDSILAAEIARMDAKQDAEQAIYDSLKVVWQQVLDDTSGRYADSLMCDPKQYVGTAKIVGPEGDDINFGEHTLHIPAGALSARTVITAEAPTSIRVTALFSPHGTQFHPNHRPTLELSYKHCQGPNRPARIAYVNRYGQIIEWPPSQDFPDLGLVRGLIGHFSNYIVAY
jgi:hypothetical protein